MLFNNIEFVETKYPDYYASKCGKILSLKQKNPRILKPLILKRLGYQHVFLYINKSYKDFYVARIIAQTFLGDHSELTVNHKDKDTSNNNVNNLEWCTLSRNIQIAFSKQSFTFNIITHEIKNYESRTKIAEFHGYSQSFISRFVNVPKIFDKQYYIFDYSFGV